MTTLIEGWAVMPIDATPAPFLGDVYLTRQEAERALRQLAPVYAAFARVCRVRVMEIEEEG